MSQLLGPLEVAFGALLLGLVGVIIAGLRAVLTGQLVPGKERDYWRDMALEEQRQKAQLLNAGRVTQDVLKALPDVVREANGP